MNYGSLCFRHHSAGIRKSHKGFNPTPQTRTPVRSPRTLFLPLYPLNTISPTNPPAPVHESRFPVAAKPKAMPLMTFTDTMTGPGPIFTTRKLSAQAHWILVYCEYSAIRLVSTPEA
jgi:hypothetical protein